MREENWISVLDGLPKEEDWVLCWHGKSKSKHQIKSRFEWYDKHSGFENSGTITHWALIPPPKLDT